MIVEPITEVGHPCSLLAPSGDITKVEYSDSNLSQLIESECLHRVFWGELIGVDGFQLEFRNGYLVQDLFISHITLGKDFFASSYEDGWKIGGVLQGGVDRNWIDTEFAIGDELSAEILSHQGEPLEDFLFDYEEISELYPVVLAYLAEEISGANLAEKFGVSLNAKAWKTISMAAMEAAEYEDFDVTASIPLDYQEELTWSGLNPERQNYLFSFLLHGLDSASQDVRDDVEHFLACMALHPKTNQNILKQLSALDNSLVATTLERRKK